MGNEIRDKNPPKSVRFDAEDRLIVEKAAKLEGLDASSYIRRCTMTYTREHHPELFQS